jgi:citrate synthase
LSEIISSITDGYYPDKILIRGYRIDELMKEKSFTDVIFLTIFGRFPTTAESKVLNAILVSCVDHGFAPSALTSRIVIGGAPEAFQGAVAAGILCMGELHGGAIEGCSKMLQEGVRRAEKEGMSLNEIAEKIVHDYWVEGKVIPGIGHPFHRVDPRVEPLFEIAREAGFPTKHVELLKAIRDVMERDYGRKLPINIDGAIGAVISDMGIDYRLGKAFFIMSRVVGLVAHVYEEIKRPAMGPIRDMARSKYKYDGPPERSL